MNFRFRNILMPFLVGAVAFSCEQNDVEEVSPSAEMSAETAGLATSANLMFSESFEGGTVLDGVRRQLGASHSFRVASSPVFAGKGSGRFELRDSDPEASNGTRAEFLFPEESVGRERWYSFKAYYPSSGYKKDSNNDILNQWHQGSGTGSPSSTFRVRNDRFLMRVGNTTESRKEYDLGVQTKDTWHEFVFHFVHSSGSDGLVEVWHNGEKKLTIKGGNMYNAPLPRWKVGIYKDNWNGDRTTDTKERIFYLDDVKMGNEKATLADMSSKTASVAPSTPAPEEGTSDPAAGTTAPAPGAGTNEPVSGNTGSSQVTGIMLVNAATEKDIQPINNGTSINLASLPSTKLNIRAITASSVGSVKLELSGTQSKTYIDNAAPYALHGDDGNGNFYYGNWNPPAAGTYTLKATPYSGAKATGTAGTPMTVTFTINKNGETVVPGTTAPTTGSSQVTGFTLIDTHTEKGVMTVTDGATIKLSSLTNTKLNIRANTASSVGSVKLELSGAQSKTYVDSAAPYALHGDDGNGNYYYGNWNPPAAGTYTLKATPYSGAKATGTAGTPVTIRFTVVK